MAQDVSGGWQRRLSRSHRQRRRRCR